MGFRMFPVLQQNHFNGKEVNKSIQISRRPCSQKTKTSRLIEPVKLTPSSTPAVEQRRSFCLEPVGIHFSQLVFYLGMCHGLLQMCLRGFVFFSQQEPAVLWKGKSVCNLFFLTVNTRLPLQHDPFSVSYK